MAKSEPKAVSKVVTLDLERQPALPLDHSTFMALAKAFEVTDEVSFAEAGTMIQKGEQWSANVNAFFKEGREAANRAHKWFTTTIRKLTDPYDVRPVLEPKMRAYRRRQIEEEERRKEDQRLEQERQRRAEEAEAQRIKDEAGRRAAALKSQGAMRQARAVVQEAAETAAAIQEREPLELIVPSARPAGGPGESMPWVGILDDMVKLCRAIGEGYPLMHGGEPLVEINQQVLNKIAKAMQQESLGIPGCHGERDLKFRFSKNGSAAKAAVHAEEW